MYRYIRTLSCSLLAAVCLLQALVPAVQAATASAARSTLTDGPYVFWEGHKARVVRVYGDHTETQIHSGPFTLDLPEPLEPLFLSPEAPGPAPADAPAAAPILAISDIHGRLAAFVKILQAHGVMDRAWKWAFGKGRLVILGDAMDGHPAVTELFWLIRSLESQAAKADGAVYFLPGNHEFMVLSGDVRNVHPKYLNLPPPLPPVQDCYGPQTEIGRWLRSRPAMVRLGPFLFVHGGVSPALIALAPELDTVNRHLRKSLGQPMGSGPALQAFLTGPQGPLWYRGLLPPAGEKSLDAGLEAALKHFGVQAIVVGHTIVKQVQAFHGGRVYGIDCGLKVNKAGEAWYWDGQKVWRALADGGRKPVAEVTAASP